jgi:hypothetical protein
MPKRTAVQRIVQLTKQRSALSTEDGPGSAAANTCAPALSARGESRDPHGTSSNYVRHCNAGGEVVTMGFYQDQIVPLLINLAMRRQDLAAYRSRVVPAANGRVLEIGIGS